MTDCDGTCERAHFSRPPQRGPWPSGEEEAAGAWGSPCRPLSPHCGALRLSHPWALTFPPEACFPPPRPTCPVGGHLSEQQDAVTTLIPCCVTFRPPSPPGKAHPTPSDVAWKHQATWYHVQQCLVPTQQVGAQPLSPVTLRHLLLLSPTSCPEERKGRFGYFNCFPRLLFFLSLW